MGMRRVVLQETSMCRRCLRGILAGGSARRPCIQYGRDLGAALTENFTGESIEGSRDFIRG
jgi:hypothetical protein